MKKYPERLLILDSNVVELSRNGEIHHNYSFSRFFEKQAEMFSSVSVVLPHKNCLNQKKINVIKQDQCLTYFLLPYFSDPINFFKRFVFDAWANIKGMWIALDECDTCLLRFPSPVLPVIYLMAVLRRKRIVLFVKGTWVHAARNLSPGFTNLLKRLIISFYEIFHRIIIRHHLTISTYPYLDLNLPNIIFGFTSLVIKEEIPAFAIRELKDGQVINALFVGRLTEAKGIFVLLEAFKEIYNNSRYGIQLHIVGDGYLKNKVEKYIKENSLEACTMLHGHLGWEQLRLLYQKSDLFILPSYTEGVPKVIIEAMINSVPVITTRVGALPLLFQDGEHCIFVEPGNVQQLAETIRKVVLDPAQSERLVTNAYKLCVQYDLESTSENIARAIHGGSGSGLLN